MEACLRYLEDNMIPELAIQPLSFDEETAWIVVSRTLATQKLGGAALDVAVRYLDVCYKMQSEVTQRIPKGRVLAWLSDCLRNLDQYELARGSMLLAFIEESILNKNHTASHTYSILRDVFEVPTETLDKLAKRVDTVSELPLFPEEILVQWELDNVPDLSELWSRG